METTETTITETAQVLPVTQEIYDYAAHLMINTEKNSFEVKKMIMERGYDASTATSIVDKLEQDIREAKKKRAGKDIIYGGLWCVGGTIFTVADTGFIFWGAIVFGAIQMIKGLVNYSNSN